MAKPILKIKTGSGKPTNYTETLVNGVVTNTQGLSAGELGATIVAPNYAFYIGNNLGRAITFGGEISTQIDLGGVAASDYKIPTQRALKTYIDQNSGNPGTSAVSVISKYKNGTQPANANETISISFDLDDFSTATGISELTYNAGVFTNTSTNIIYLLITYQIAWSTFTTTVGYNTRSIIRSAWIQKGGSGITVPGDNVYGFNTLLCPPLASSLLGSISGTQNASAIIQLNPNENFSINCKNHGSSQTSVNNSIYANDGSGSNIIITKATNIQIAKL